MKRTGLIAVLGLSLVALIAPGVSAHRDGPGGPGGHGDHHGRDHQPFRAYATDGDVGGSMDIFALVGGRRSACATDVTVSAVVNFQSGAVTVALPAVQRGEHDSRHLFEGSAPVAGEEPIGPVTIDVTASCGDLSATVTVMASVTEPSAS